ncbi:hypothetical protein HRF87_04385 [Bacillus sp. CRN 9]|nr:hypothetical protein [Bacillus sp. CRN 9]
MLNSSAIADSTRRSPGFNILLPILFEISSAMIIAVVFFVDVMGFHSFHYLI